MQSGPHRKKIKRTKLWSRLSSRTKRNSRRKDKKGDSVIFYNIRGEREIELTESLTRRGFDKFPAENDLALTFATMIEYKNDLNVKVAFRQRGR